MTLLGRVARVLGLCVRPPLLGLEHVLQSNGTDCTIGQLMLDESRPDGSTIVRAGHPVQRKITKRGDAWAWSRSRTSTARSTCCCSPAPGCVVTSSTTTRSSPSGAGSRGRRTSPRSTAREVSVPDLSDGPSGPVVISLPSTCGAPRWPSEQLRAEVLGTHRGMTEVRLRPLTREQTMVMRARRPTPRHAEPLRCSADLKHLLGPGCLTG